VLPAVTSQIAKEGPVLLKDKDLPASLFADASWITPNP
jgi:hypothetical protein